MKLFVDSSAFEEASTTFRDLLSLTINDPLHLEDEPRFVLIGESYKNRILVVIHSERGDNDQNHQRKKGH